MKIHPIIFPLFPGGTVLMSMFIKKIIKEELELPPKANIYIV